MTELQRMVDRLRTEFEGAMMPVESTNYFGIPDEDSKYRLEFVFEGSHSKPGVADFVHDVADELSTKGLQYEVESVRRHKSGDGSEYVFIIKVNSGI